MLPTDHPHYISPEDAKAAITAFQRNEIRTSVAPVFALTFGADALASLINQDGAVAVRFYHAICKDRQTLVGTAVREDGTVIDTLFIENAYPCPPFC